MAAYKELHEAVIESVIGLNLPCPVSYENDDYDPQENNDNAFVDLSLLYNEQESLDKTLFDEVTFILQLTVRTRSGTGTKVSNDIIDIITGFYKHNIKLVNGNQCAVVINSGRNEGRNINGWWTVDTSTSFKSDIAR